MRSSSSFEPGSERGDQVADFRLVVSRFGMPGESQTYWTISSTGKVLKETVARSGSTATTSTTLKLEDIRRIQLALLNLGDVDDEYLGEMAVHDNLGLTLYWEGTLSKTVTIMNRPQLPPGIGRLLEAVDNALGEGFGIGY